MLLILSFLLFIMDRTFMLMLLILSFLFVIMDRTLDSELGICDSDLLIITYHYNITKIIGDYDTKM